MNDLGFLYLGGLLQFRSLLYGRAAEPFALDYLDHLQKVYASSIARQEIRDHL